MDTTEASKQPPSGQGFTKVVSLWWSPAVCLGSTSCKPWCSAPSFQGMCVSFSNWWEQTALNISYTKYFIIVMCCYVQHCCTCYVVLLFYQSFFQTVLNVFGQDCQICPIMKRVLFRQVLFFSMYVLGNIFLTKFYLELLQLPMLFLLLLYHFLFWL